MTGKTDGWSVITGLNDISQESKNSAIVLCTENEMYHKIH